MVHIHKTVIQSVLETSNCYISNNVFEAMNPKTVIEDILQEIIAKWEQAKEFHFNEFLMRKPLSGESMEQYATALEILQIATSS